MYGSYYYGFDSTFFLLVIPALLLSLWAQGKVKSTYAKYQMVTNRRGVTAEQVARNILDRNGLQKIPIERVRGQLTDHYDPKEHAVRLSDGVYGSTSVAAIGIAAHEVGHAIQHSQNYAPLSIRNAVIPVTGFASQLAIPLFLIGFFFNYGMLVWAGVFFFAGAVLVQLLTLPVEFNASHRALQILESTALLYDEEELRGAKRVLTAAAMTYVAALAVALAQLLRLLILARGRGGRRG